MKRYNGLLVRILVRLLMTDRQGSRDSAQGLLWNNISRPATRLPDSPSAAQRTGVATESAMVCPPMTSASLSSSTAVPTTVHCDHLIQARVEVVHLGRESIGPREIIRILSCQILPSRQRPRTVEGCGQPRMFLPNHTHARISLRPLGQHPRSLIRGAIIHDQQLKCGKRLGQHTLDRRGHVLLSIVVLSFKGRGGQASNLPAPGHRYADHGGNPAPKNAQPRFSIVLPTASQSRHDGHTAHSSVAIPAELNDVPRQVTKPRSFEL